MKTFKPLAGTSIRRAIDDSIELAKSSKENVTFDFNDHTLVVTPSSLPGEVMDSWNRQVKLSMDKYHASAEYKQKLLGDDIRKRTNQNKANMLMDTFVGSCISLHTLIPWLREFTFIADNIGVTVDIPDIYNALKMSGYTSNEGTGHPKEYYDDKVNFGRYIVGQCMTFLEKGRSPHPVAISFIDQWLEK